MVSTSIILLQTRLPHTLMQTGLVVLTLDDLHPAFVFIWVTILFLGLPKGRLQFPDRLQKLNTGLLLILWPRRCGSVSFWLSFIDQSSMQLLCIATIFLQSTWRPILFSIDAQSTSRLIFILFVKRLLLVRFGCFMFPLRLSLLTFSPRHCLLSCFKISVSVSTSSSLPLILQGDVRVVIMVYDF